MAEEEKKSETREREVLPSSVIPKNYAVSLTPDLVTHFRFVGSVSIDLQINEDDVTSIMCNSIELTWLSVNIKSGDNTYDIPVSNLIEDLKKQQMTIPLPDGVTLAKDSTAVLNISFVGILNDQMRGFYRSRYNRKDGTEAYVGMTQFEATDARRAFPCWDEPGRKATFDLTMTVPQDLVCISNMPEKESVSHGTALRTVTFERTPVMSTYLLAWFIAEFNSIESATSRGVPVKVWTMYGKESEGQFALETACKCLDLYEKYFGIPYALPKVDMVACPLFAAGAMENWGLVTYRETALLATPGKSSRSQLHRVAVVVTHELAHMWFGNLVTMTWWDALYLNESFATFMMYKSADAIYPTDNYWHDFIIDRFARGYDLDAMSTSHPIEVEVFTSHEAEEVFDAISYCKGAAVLRMLECYIEQDRFGSGVTEYLKHFSYSNAVTDDLWKFLGKAAEDGKDVWTIMQNWSKKQGYPLLCSTFDKETRKLTVSQRRHLNGGVDTEGTIWMVPLILKTNLGEIATKYLLTEKEQCFMLPEGTLWVHMNCESKGFYATSYEKSNFEELLSLKNGELSTIDKLTLVRDTASVAQAGDSAEATEKLLSLIAAFKDEESYPLWDSLLTSVGKLRHLIEDNDVLLAAFNTKIESAISGVWSRVGWDIKEDESADITQSLRPTLIRSMAACGNKDVVAACLDRFQKFMDASVEERTPEFLHPALRSAVFAVAIRNGGKKEFDLLRDFYRNAQDAAEKSFSLQCLGRTKDAALLKDLLEWAQSSDEVRTQDKVFPLFVVGSNVFGRQLAFEFLQANFDAWYKMFDGGFMVQYLVKVPSSFVDEDKANEVEAFFKTIDAPATVRSQSQCLEKIRMNAKWRLVALPVIEKWVKGSD